MSLKSGAEKLGRPERPEHLGNTARVCVLRLRDRKMENQQQPICFTSFLFKIAVRQPQKSPLEHVLFRLCARNNCSNTCLFHVSLQTYARVHFVFARCHCSSSLRSRSASICALLRAALCATSRAPGLGVEGFPPLHTLILICSSPSVLLYLATADLLKNY